MRGRRTARLGLGSTRGLLRPAGEPLRVAPVTGPANLGIAAIVPRVPPKASSAP